MPFAHWICGKYKNNSETPNKLNSAGFGGPPAKTERLTTVLMKSINALNWKIPTTILTEREVQKKEERH